MSAQAGEIWYATSVMAALMLYGLAIFFFVFGILPYWFKLHKHLNEILGCWALTFPNGQSRFFISFREAHCPIVGWISTTRALGDIFHLNGLFSLHLIMAVIMCITWVILFILTVMAFWRGLIFRSKPEDVLKDSMPAKMMDEEKRAGTPDSFESMETSVEHPHLNYPQAAKF